MNCLRNHHRLLTCFYVLITFVTPNALAEALTEGQIEIRGQVQFWERSCDEKANCALPTTIGNREPVVGVLDRPKSPNQVTVWRHRFSRANMEALTTVYWRTTETLPHQYLVQQTRLFVDGHMIAECSSYQGVPSKAFLAIGACSGLTDNGTKQRGISFYR